MLLSPYAGYFLPQYTSVGGQTIESPRKVLQSQRLSFDSRAYLWEIIRFLEKPHALYNTEQQRARILESNFQERLLPGQTKATLQEGTGKIVKSF